MIEEHHIKVIKFEYAGRFVLMDCHDIRLDKTVRIKMAREDLDFVVGRNTD